MPRRLIAMLIFAFACLLSAPIASAQNTYWVTTTAASGPGSLRAAVAAMQFNGSMQTIRFSLPAASQITLDAGLGDLTGTQVEIIGSDTPQLRIDGAQFPIFRYSGQSLLLRDVILANGRSEAGGCLTVNTTISSVVEDSQFINCSTYGTAASGSSGGAIRAFGALRVSRSRFTNNFATDGGLDNLALGGGAIGFGGASLLIEDSHFIGNRVIRTERAIGGCIDGVGGALSLTLDSNGLGMIRRSNFQDNQSRCGSAVGPFSGQAGALFAIGPGTGVGPILAIESSFFGGNRAHNGAGIFARAVRLHLTNASFYDQVGAAAGAVFLTTGFGASPPVPELRVNASTFWRNGTSNSSFGADLTLNAAVIVRELRNTIFAPRQSGGACMPASFNADAGAAVFATHFSCFATVAGNLVTSQFADTNTLGLQMPVLSGSGVPVLNLAAGSVAIDNGSNSGCATADARGYPRPYDGDQTGGAVCDVGAIEYRPDLLHANGFEN